eukprot:1828183-Amphidinium_carterae.1
MAVPASQVTTQVAWPQQNGTSPNDQPAAASCRFVNRRWCCKHVVRRPSDWGNASALNSLPIPRLCGAMSTRS